MLREHSHHLWILTLTPQENCHAFMEAMNLGSFVIYLGMLGIENILEDDPTIL